MEDEEIEITEEIREEWDERIDRLQDKQFLDEIRRDM